MHLLQTTTDEQTVVLDTNDMKNVWLAASGYMSDHRCLEDMATLKTSNVDHRRPGHKHAPHAQSIQPLSLSLSFSLSVFAFV